MKSKRVSQTEIARRLGVSQRTISKALRNEPDISEKTRELVPNDREISRKAAELCLGMIKGVEKLRNIVILTKLIERESCQQLT